jgi:hypothetical protein
MLAQPCCHISLVALIHRNVVCRPRRHSTADRPVQATWELEMGRDEQELRGVSGGQCRVMRQSCTRSRDPDPARYSRARCRAPGQTPGARALARPGSNPRWPSASCCCSCCPAPGPPGPPAGEPGPCTTSSQGGLSAPRRPRIGMVRMERAPPSSRCSPTLPAGGGGTQGAAGAGTGGSGGGKARQGGYGTYSRGDVT